MLRERTRERSVVSNLSAENRIRRWKRCERGVWTKGDFGFLGGDLFVLVLLLPDDAPLITTSKLVAWYHNCPFALALRLSWALCQTERDP